MQDRYVVWRWGSRWVNTGKVLDENDQTIVVLITDVEGTEHHLIIPKGSFKWKFFDTQEEATRFLKEQDEKRVY